MTPATEVHIVADQNQLWPAQDFTFTDLDTGVATDLDPYDIRLQVRDGNNGTVILEWSTEDATITKHASPDDNPEEINNVARLAEKTALVMNITAKTYVYKWEMRIPESDWVKYMYGNVIINA